jgi:hypothetical protein
MEDLPDRRWAKRSVPTIPDSDHREMVGTAQERLCPPLRNYSAAIWRGAGGGLTRSAANCVYRAFASSIAFSFTGP